MRTPRATTTLGDLHRATPWLWLNCERCQHHAPLACAVAVIRWGRNESSDVLRQRARCTRCDHKGAPASNIRDGAVPTWVSCLPNRLELNGEDIRAEPLEERKRRLTSHRNAQAKSLASISAL
jgi:hypothetical protein